MNIKLIKIQNYKCFEGVFTLSLNKGVNILVGDNGVGKSTLLDSVYLALTGWTGGRHISTELTQSLFNKNIVKAYLDDPTKLDLPEIIIELYLDVPEELDSLKASLEGNGNTEKKKACGIQFKISFNEDYRSEYNCLLKEPGGIKSLPIEYYEYSWSSFARNDSITPRSIPIKPSYIDSSSSRFQHGSDVYISSIMKNFLSEQQKVKIGQAHRKLQDDFRANTDVRSINQLIQKQDISEKTVTLDVDVSTKTAWETSLVTCLDEIPFNYIGQGEQAIVKTNLALNHKKSLESGVILLEEPENHLTHSKLNSLLQAIKFKSKSKQILVSTHSSFVANKLGLNKLILLNEDPITKRKKKMFMSDLKKDTQNYFEKLAGYDTLRLILCKKALLVEGDSDELIVQRSYLDLKGALPIQEEVEVISVRSLAFKRFLEISALLKQPTVVVTDNDGDYDQNVVEKYTDFKDVNNIIISASKNEELETLEPQIVEANKDNLEILRKILQIQEKEYPNTQTITEYMRNNKVTSALKIFDAKDKINYPQYIIDSINWEYNEK